MLGEAAAREEGVRKARGLVRAWAGAHLRVRRAMLSANPEPTHALGSRKGECGDRAWELCARGEEGGAAAGSRAWARWLGSKCGQKKAIDLKQGGVTTRTCGRCRRTGGAASSACEESDGACLHRRPLLPPTSEPCTVGYGHRHGAVYDVGLLP